MKRSHLIMVIYIVGPILAMLLLIQHHGRLAASVLLCMMLGTYCIAKFTRPSKAEVVESNDPERQAALAKSLRRYGWLYVAFLVLGLMTTDFRHAPFWPIFVGISISGSIIFTFFYLAKKTGERARKLDAGNPSRD